MEVSLFPTTKVNGYDIEDVTDNNYDDDAGSVKKGVTSQLKTGREGYTTHLLTPGHRESTQYTRVELWSTKVSGAMCGSKLCNCLGHRRYLCF